MICRKNTAEVKIGREDVEIALQMFLNENAYGSRKVRVLGVEVHRQGSKYLLTVKVCDSEFAQENGK